MTDNARLRDALERTLHNFKAVLARRPVRDAEETIAEAEWALRTTLSDNAPPTDMQPVERSRTRER